MAQVVHGARYTSGIITWNIGWRRGPKISDIWIEPTHIIATIRNYIQAKGAKNAL